MSELVAMRLVYGSQSYVSFMSVGYACRVLKKLAEALDKAFELKDDVEVKVNHKTAFAVFDVYDQMDKCGADWLSNVARIV